MAIPPPAGTDPRSPFDPGEPAPRVPAPLPEHRRRPSTIAAAALAVLIVVVLIVVL